MCPWAHFGHILGTKVCPWAHFFAGHILGTFWAHFVPKMCPKCAQTCPKCARGNIWARFRGFSVKMCPKCAHLQKCSKNVPKCAQWQSIKSQFYIQWWHFGHILGTIFEPLQNVPTAFWFVLNFSTLMQRYHRRMGS